MPDFAKLLARLTHEKVEFIVCGGVALGFNGFVRTTEDLDILIAVSEENIRRLAQALFGFGEGFGARITLADFPMEPGNAPAGARRAGRKLGLKRQRQSLSF